MKAYETRFLSKVASIQKAPAKEYIKEVKDTNEYDEEAGGFIPLGLPDLESTVVCTSIVIKSSNVLLDKRKFEKSELKQAIIWTADNVKYNGVVSFQFLDHLMVGFVMSMDWAAEDGSPYWTGIYLIDDEHSFAFIRVEEFYKKK